MRIVLAVAALLALTGCGGEDAPANTCPLDPTMAVEGVVVERNLETSTLTVICTGDGTRRAVRVDPIVADITPVGDHLTVPKGYTP